MRGIILAGGKGTRLAPATRITNKHLLPILNQPMIIFPLATLKSFGIRDILIVSGGEHIGGFAEFLGDGSEYGVNLTYRVQKEAGGIAEALGLGKDFAHGEPILVILGDNVFDNRQFRELEAFDSTDATLFLTKVPDPERFGVAKLTKGGTHIETIIEKPKDPPSDLAVTGLYFYPADVFEVVETLVPSSRGELEITDVNNYYVQQSRCDFRVLSRFWSDAGTPESLFRTCSWAMSKL
jgi:glucose-1-phosphate thymidylyltransferase